MRRAGRPCGAGPRRRDQTGAWRAIELGDNEALHLAAGSDAWPYVQIGGCYAFADGDPALALPPDRTPARVELWADVAPGRYFLELGECAPIAASGTSSYEVELGSFPIGSSCDTAGTVNLAGSHTLGFVGNSADGAWYLWMDAGEEASWMLGGDAFNPFGGNTALSTSLCT